MRSFVQIGLGLSLSLFCGGAHAQVESGCSASLYLMRTIDLHLHPILHEGILNETDHAQGIFKLPHSDHSPFQGSYDWYSSVSAHWTLLSMSRVTHHERKRKKILARLDIQGLQKAEKVIFDEENQGRGSVYGEFWFNLLLSELSRHSDYPHLDEVKRIRIRMEERLLNWLNEPYMPDFWARGHGAQTHYSGFYERGDHYSWIFLYFLFRASRPISELAHQELPRLEKRWPEIKAQVEHYQPREWDFLDLPSLIRIIDRKPNTTPEGIQDRLKENVTFENCHELGQGLVRSWEMAMAMQISSVYRASYPLWITSLMADHPQVWAENFQLVSHWTPQFIWMGMMIARGEIFPLDPKKTSLNYWQTRY